MGIERLEFVVVLGGSAEVGEEPLEDIGHQIPGGAHIEAEAVNLEPAGPSSELFVLFEDRHGIPLVGEETRRCEATDPAPDDHDTPVGTHTGLGRFRGEAHRNTPRGSRATSPVRRPVDRVGV